MSPPPHPIAEFNGPPRRASVAGIFASVVGCTLLTVGCHASTPVPRRPVAELYRDAVADAQTRPLPSHVADGTVRPASYAEPGPENGPPPEIPPFATAAPASDGPATAEVRPSLDDYYDPGSESLVAADESCPSPSSPRSTEPPHTATAAGTVRLAQWDQFDNALRAGGRHDEADPSVLSAVDRGRSSGDGIYESFQELDVREAIALLADYGNHRVLVDDAVAGYVNAEIRGADFPTALEQILAPLGYLAVHEPDVTIICPPEPDAPLFSRIAVRDRYQGRFQNVADMVDLLPGRYQPFLKISESRNLVAIEAPAAAVDDIRQRLAELDRPVPQVELEAIVCVVSPESGMRFGLDWNHVVDVNGVDSLSAGITGLAFNASGSRRGLRNVFSNFSVTSAFVRALEKEGYLSIRAAPRVTARDGETAKIDIARETFFSLQPSATNVLFRQDVQKVQAGIGLDITPQIRGDVISVRIDRAEVSEEIQNDDPDLAGTAFPEINRRTVTTHVDVRDGETIVIGGLVQRQQFEQTNRVPGLSRAPLIGKWFQTKRVEEKDVEVAVFISPRIVPPIGSAAVSVPAGLSPGDLIGISDASGGQTEWSSISNGVHPSPRPARRHDGPIHFHRGS